MGRWTTILYLKSWCYPKTPHILWVTIYYFFHRTNWICFFLYVTQKSKLSSRCAATNLLVYINVLSIKSWSTITDHIYIYSLFYSKSIEQTYVINCSTIFFLSRWLPASWLSDFHYGVEFEWHPHKRMQSHVGNIRSSTLSPWTLKIRFKSIKHQVSSRYII